MSQWDQYLSPFSWRYGSTAMRRVWAEQHKRELWRQIWLGLAETQAEFGLVSQDQVDDLRAHINEIDIPRSHEIEAEIHHDLMAELKAYAEQCSVGGGIIHLGATSMDIEDNADALRLKSALELIQTRLDELLQAFAERIEETAAVPTMAYTHLQPAEPTTVGYRLSLYAQDLLTDREALIRVHQALRGKGFKGAVGTSAAYADLLGVQHLAAFEEKMTERLNLKFFPITAQTYPRKQDYQVISALADIGMSLYKFAFDVRLMQSAPIGEWSEPFAKQQVGSSAMPFKRNPILSEKIDSLARSLSVMPQVAWNNAAHSLLERTLDDSANRRSLLPEAFLICDEILRTAPKIVKGMVIHPSAVEANLEKYAPFAVLERVLIALARKGADRQETHEHLREMAMNAWVAIQEGQPNPLLVMLHTDQRITAVLGQDELNNLLDIKGYIGLTVERASQTAQMIRRVIRQEP